jgi:hypothetical protein
MDKEQLKKLIQEIYDDYDFAEFTLHFVDCVGNHKVYEIKNNRINNKLVDTTMLVSNIAVSDSQRKDLLLYGIDVKDFFVRKIIAETADKILSDVYKVNKREWFYSQSSPVKIELTITNWQLHEEEIENGIAYGIRFEFA